ncbi:MAG: hypothetical protein ACFB4J_17765 [Elainellaceae cyanobacterium]
MQIYLTILFNVLLAAGGGYLSIAFVLGLLDFWQQCDPDRRDALPAKADLASVDTRSAKVKRRQAKKAKARQAKEKKAEAPQEAKVPLEPIPLGELKRSGASHQDATPPENKPDLVERRSSTDEADELRGADLLDPEPPADSPQPFT